MLYLCFTGRSEEEAFVVAAGGGGGMSRSEGGGVNGRDSSLSSASSETQVDVIFKVDDKYCFQIYFCYDSRLNESMQTNLCKLIYAN